MIACGEWRWWICIERQCRIGVVKLEEVSTIYKADVSSAKSDLPPIFSRVSSSLDVDPIFFVNDFIELSKAHLVHKKF